MNLLLSCSLTRSFFTVGNGHMYGVCSSIRRLSVAVKMEILHPFLRLLLSLVPSSLQHLSLHLIHLPLHLSSLFAISINVSVYLTTNVCLPIFIHLCSLKSLNLFFPFFSPYLSPFPSIFLSIYPFLPSSPYLIPHISLSLSCIPSLSSQVTLYPLQQLHSKYDSAYFVSLIHGHFLPSQVLGEIFITRYTDTGRREQPYLSL